MAPLMSALRHSKVLRGAGGGSRGRSGALHGGAALPLAADVMDAHLPEVCSEGYDLAVVLFLQPFQDDRCVEAT